ncbi:MAG: hypothetical protein NWE83_14970 [Candidatus Bathyarchaeota archaeon]|jgi:hypothetical protein|nr:hypothetical protein [Candidatus Bathyarchaeota archaeon]
MQVTRALKEIQESLASTQQSVSETTRARIEVLFPAIPFLLLINQDLNINKIYWYLPYFNTILGGLLFTYLTITNGL